MNGCAGVFPAMLGVLMGSAVGAEMNLSFYILVVVVVTVGSIGIAGVPGISDSCCNRYIEWVRFWAHIDKYWCDFWDRSDR